jgi:hypothetical protein
MPTILQTEAKVIAALRKRFQSPAWAMFTGVANATGHRANRWADAVAMGIWPSRGQEIVGFEVKVHRSDWLRELKKPEKAESIFKFCDRWWIAAGSAAIVREGELPATWGLLIPHGKTMKVVTEAPQLQPVAVERGFVAAILRRAVEHFDETRIRGDLEAELRKEAVADAEKLFAEHLELERERVTTAKEDLAEVRRTLELATDMSYSPAMIGRAIALLQKLDGWNGAVKQIEILLDGVERDKGRLDEICDSLRATQELVGQIGAKPRKSRKQDAT